MGYYIGNDDADHGFLAHTSSISNGMLTGTAIADPTIPPVAGEPGATFVFSQILAVNDNGVAVGYYQDSTGSQHGFLYNTNTGTYTFLDDPSATFTNGVEITQITGINNSGEITGFYSGPNGVLEGFVAVQSVPEPGSIALLGIGLATLAGTCWGSSPSHSQIWRSMTPDEAALRCGEEALDFGSACARRFVVGTWNDPSPPAMRNDHAHESRGRTGQAQGEADQAVHRQQVGRPGRRR